jgi:hypothetical protein
VSTGHDNKLGKFWDSNQEKLIFIGPLNNHYAVTIKETWG